MTGRRDGRRSRWTERSRKIATVAIITANRPHLLVRCLQSLAQNCTLAATRPRIIIVDGSGQPRHRDANRRAGQEIARRSRLAVDYVGPHEARALRAGLAAAGIPRATLRFGLTPGPTGANRNIAALLAGRHDFLMLDDDIVCTPWTLGAPQSGITVAGTVDLREVRFCSNRREALEIGRAAPISLLAAHRELLGATLTELTSGADTADVHYGSGSGDLLSGLGKGIDYRVRASFAGLAGDSATSCPYLVLFATGALKEHLSTDPAAFATALRSREVIRVATRTIVTRVPNCMAGCMAVSNDALLPPFLPSGRNEDGLFGVMLRLMEPTALFGHLPYGIVHDSERPPAYAFAKIPSVTEIRLADLLISFVRRVPLTSVSASTNLQLLADSLSELSASSTREFIRYATYVTLEDRCRRLAELKHRVALDASYPAYWRKAVDEYLGTFRGSVARRDFYLPVEFQGRGSVDRGFRQAQPFIGEFAELMRWWPRMNLRTLEP